MTTSSPEPETPNLPSDLLFSEPDPRAKTRKRRTEFLQICWHVILSSVLISIYAIILVQHLAPAASQSDLDKAALVLANELSTLTVKHSKFGDVGLLQVRDNQRQQTGLNYLHATLALDNIIADSLHSPHLKMLVANDISDAASLASSFARMERELAKPTSQQNILGHQSLKALAHKVFSRSGTENRLRNLKIVLGGISNQEFSSKALLPAGTPASVVYGLKGNYKTHIPVEIGDSKYEFYEQADQIILVPPEQFVPISETAVASAVYIEAEFDVSDRGSPQKLQKMKSCALVGAPNLAIENSVLMFSFPQGYLSSFASLGDFFDSKRYTTTDGDWLQAAFAAVPGPGHLTAAKPNPSLHRAPNLAALDTFYSFIFSAGPGLVPETLVELLKQPISSVSLHADHEADESDELNSGFFKDTGAALFTLNRQSQFRGLGQKAVAAAFSGKKISELMPDSTFPLLIDSDGSVRMPHANDFDQELLMDFLNRLYQTNIAGIETMQVADTVVQRMQKNIAQSTKDIASIDEEIASLRRSLEGIAEKGDQKREQTLKEKVSDQINALMEKRQEQKDSIKKNEKISARALLAKNNGRRAARSCYEIASHMASFGRQGLRRASPPAGSFLLGRTVMFVPHTTPVDEDDLYDLQASAVSSESAETKSAQPETENSAAEESWMSEQFEVNRIPDPTITVDGKSFVEFFQAIPISSLNRSLYVLLNSAEIQKAKGASLFLSRHTPFEEGVISKFELLFFAPHCVESKADWTMLIRNLVYSTQEKSGQPIQSNRPHWCTDLGMKDSSCPGLAAEIQIRTPVPRLNKKFDSLQLQDPDGGPPATLYPPLPAELL